MTVMAPYCVTTKLLCISPDHQNPASVVEGLFTDGAQEAQFWRGEVLTNYRTYDHQDRLVILGPITEYRS